LGERERVRGNLKYQQAFLNCPVMPLILLTPLFSPLKGEKSGLVFNGIFLNYFGNIY
jgi:hypothetical protein